MTGGTPRGTGAAGEGTPGRLSQEEAKTLVKGATLAVFEHYSGAPRSVPPPDRRPWGRYSFDCPGCGSPKGLKMTVFDDGRPPGYGRGGCPADLCPVPRNGDVFDLVRAMLGRGKKTRPSFDEILAAVLPIARRASSGEAGVAHLAGAASEPDEPSGLFVSGSLSLPPDPAEGQHGGGTGGGEPDALFGPRTDEREGTAGDVPARKPGGGKHRGSAVRGSQRANPPAAQRQPDLLSVVPETFPETAKSRARADLKADLKADLAARARVYEGLLRLCPPDGRLVEDLKALGISEGLLRREGFGAFYPARAAGAMASLQLELGAGALPAAPGFEQPVGGVPPRFEIEGGGEDALYALVPYRDARGRVIALEAIDLSRPETFGGHRLVGGGMDGRDDALGGAHHVWYPGDPALLQAVTDDLLEGLRAASTGVRCAAIRGPQSFSPGAGRETLPGLEGVSLAGRRVLYAPGPSSRAREAAPAAARALIASRGGRALVSRKAIEGKKGLGSYLLGHAPDERLRAFALLCSEANVAVLPAEAAPVPRGAEGTQIGPPPRPRADAQGVGKAPGERGSGEAPRPEPFHVEARKTPAGPSRRRGSLWAERLWGVAGGGFVFVAAWAPLAALLGLCRGLIGAFAGAVSDAAASMAAGGRIPLGEPYDWPAWLLARLLGPWAEGSAQALSTAAGGASLGMVPALFGVLVAVPAGLFVTAARHRHRRKRIKLVEGRLKQW